jgi:hypothetical protein
MSQGLSQGIAFTNIFAPKNDGLARLIRIFGESIFNAWRFKLRAFESVSDPVEGVSFLKTR